MKTIDINDDTFKRLFSLSEDLMHQKKKDITIDDVINDLIDTYQDNHWGHLGSIAGGG